MGWDEIEGIVKFKTNCEGGGGGGGVTTTRCCGKWREGKGGGGHIIC